jgi:2-polyprenyl-3-methyl-5-hydroxy-6-metoxy-1,4-benzoquinol methylase
VNNCQCRGIETEFDRREAARRLADYRKNGPASTTRMLIEALQSADVANLTLLNVGGGIGAIQYALLKAGARSAISVDASTAYIDAAKEEARRQGLHDRISFHRGDFVKLADDIPPVDIVTLDRVICCFDDMPALVSLSAARARELYGLVYPRDAAWIRLALRLENLFQRIKGSHFRAFVHPTAAVEAILHQYGLARRHYRRSGVWQIAVYGR